MKIRGQDVEIKMKQGHSRDTLGTTYKKIAGASGMFPMDSQRAETQGNTLPGRKNTIPNLYSTIMKKRADEHYVPPSNNSPGLHTHYQRIPKVLRPPGKVSPPLRHWCMNLYKMLMKIPEEVR